jgi:hypothetical protein
MADKRPNPPTDEAMKATAIPEWEREGGAPSDPIEGFDFIDYQDGRLTIQVDRRILKNRRSIEALEEKMVEILKSGSNAVDVVPRKRWRPGAW